LATVGLDKVYDMYPRELSGGMRQRVGIARALVMDPKILVLDEPFSQLDLITASELRSEVLDIWQDRNLTIIMVSHLIEEAVELADRIVIMDEGEIKKIVPIDLSRPRRKTSKEFLETVGEIEAAMGLKNGSQ
jgi:NitT/TauT family transport system ATP-binding protein